MLIFRRFDAVPNVTKRGFDVGNPIKCIDADAERCVQPLAPAAKHQKRVLKLKSRKLMNLLSWILYINYCLTNMISWVGSRIGALVGWRKKSPVRLVFVGLDGAGIALRFHRNQ